LKRRDPRKQKLRVRSITHTEPFGRIKYLADARNQAVVENPEACPHHCSWPKSISQSQPWLKVVQVVALDEFVRIGFEIVTKTVSECELTRGFPFVLGEEPVSVVVQIGNGR